MFLNRSKAGAVVLMASCAISLASLTTLATSKGRVFTTDARPVYVNVSSTVEGVRENFLHNFVTVNILPEIKRVQGVGTATVLGKRGYAMRIRLNPDQMRAHNLTAEDIQRAFIGCHMIGSPEQLATKTWRSKENELIHIGLYNKEENENLILRANADGELLRLKDVAELELDTQLHDDIHSDVDGHPSAGLVLKPAPGSNAAEVIEEVKKKLERIKADSFPPGMEFQVISRGRRE